MKRLRYYILVAIAACLLATAADRPKTFTGEITDSPCALKVHSRDGSHNDMLKSHTMGEDAASCTRMCVHDMGGQYVLLDKDTVYRLAPQDKAEGFAGQKVEITGTLLEKGKKIQIKDVKATH